jgi:hypothetical protein
MIGGMVKERQKIGKGYPPFFMDRKTPETVDSIKRLEYL